jgi:hypothetical protein
MKKSYFIMLMALGLLLLNCRTEITNDAEPYLQTNVTQKTEKLKTAIVFREFYFALKQQSKTIYADFLEKINDESEVLIITKPNETSYSTIVYNEDKSFNVLVYSTSDKKNFLSLLNIFQILK